MHNFKQFCMHPFQKKWNLYFFMLTEAGLEQQKQRIQPTPEGTE